MTASYLSPNSRMSNFTLKLLESTGWYKPNYSLAMPLMWGYKRGCGFIEDLCMDSATKEPKFGEFCNNLNQITCSLDRRYKANCMTARQGAALASSTWDYFGGGIRSADPFSDNCPYPVIGLANSDCYYATNASVMYDEVLGINSRCFEGTLVKSEFNHSSLGNAYCFNYNVISTL